MKELKDSEIKTSPPKKPLIFYYLAALIVLMLLNVFLFPSLLERQVVEVPYSQFLTMVDGGQVEQVPWMRRAGRSYSLPRTTAAGRAITRPASGRMTASGCWPSSRRRRGSPLLRRFPPRPTPFSPSW